MKFNEIETRNHKNNIKFLNKWEADAPALADLIIDLTELIGYETIVNTLNEILVTDMNTYSYSHSNFMLLEKYNMVCAFFGYEEFCEKFFINCTHDQLNIVCEKF